MKNNSSYHTRQNSQSMYGGNSELQQFMNDFDNKGGLDASGGVGVSGIQDTSVTGNKPKMVLKDSSKYVKKKPA